MAFQLLKENTGGKKINILEIGTGSGAIAISIAYEINDRLGISGPSWHIIATEIDPGALEIAEKNCRNILDDSKSGNIEFIRCDLVPEKDSDLFKKYQKKINLIISNPPYISEDDYKDLPREVRDYEPKSALIAGETGLESYRKILKKIKPYLSESMCHILFETDPKTSISLKEISKDLINPKQVTIEKDYNNRDRILIVDV
jgi:release factor glutamine methyltransferase